MFPDNMQAGVAIMRGWHEISDLKHVCDGSTIHCDCLEEEIRRRYPDELADITNQAIDSAIYAWAMAKAEDAWNADPDHDESW
jgi:hypothetical protein